MKRFSKIIPGMIMVIMLGLGCKSAASDRGDQSDFASAGVDSASIQVKDSVAEEPAQKNAPVYVGDVKSSLLALITNTQRKHVRTSSGIFGDQCFTKGNYDAFERAGVTRSIVDSLRGDAAFRGIVEALRQKSVDERNSIFVLAVANYRPTWADLSLDPSVAPVSELEKGQTTDGSNAEHEISEAIVGLIKEMLKQ